MTNKQLDAWEQELDDLRAPRDRNGRKLPRGLSCGLYDNGTYPDLPRIRELRQLIAQHNRSN